MLRDLAPKAEASAVRRARKLRREMSLPEVLLWRELRRRPCGLKFRRQHPSGPYILDFYCGDARLAVEIDGLAHEMGNRPERDCAREEWLASAGLMTIRIPAAEILRDVIAVTNSIAASACRRLPLHHPAAPGGPPPRDKLGEDH